MPCTLGGRCDAVATPSILHRPIQRTAGSGPAARLLPLSRLLEVQWQAWGNHLERMWMAVCWGPRQAATVGRLHTAWRTGALASATLMLLDVRKNTLVAHAWQPADLDEALRQQELALPIQCLRHGSRSAWLAAGEPINDIDALCGHFRRGAEAWSPASLLAPDDLLVRLGRLVDARLGALAEGRRHE